MIKQTNRLAAQIILLTLVFSMLECVDFDPILIKRSTQKYCTLCQPEQIQKPLVLHEYILKFRCEKVVQIFSYSAKGIGKCNSLFGVLFLGLSVVWVVVNVGFWMNTVTLFEYSYGISNFFDMR